jgi:primosomal replication protein N
LLVKETTQVEGQVEIQVQGQMEIKVQGQMEIQIQVYLERGEHEEEEDQRLLRCWRSRPKTTST